MMVSAVCLKVIEEAKESTEIAGMGMHQKNSKINEKVQAQYKRLGKFQAFDYEPPDYKTELDVVNHLQISDNCEYSGQVKKMTKVREGLGVSLYDDGSMYEGWYKDNM